jgi:hypothetical protein
LMIDHAMRAQRASERRKKQNGWVGPGHLLSVDDAGQTALEIH